MFSRDVLTWDLRPLSKYQPLCAPDSPPASITSSSDQTVVPAFVLITGLLCLLFPPLLTPLCQSWTPVLLRPFPWTSLPCSMPVLLCHLCGTGTDVHIVLFPRELFLGCRGFCKLCKEQQFPLHQPGMSRIEVHASRY